MPRPSVVPVPGRPSRAGEAEDGLAQLTAGTDGVWLLGTTFGLALALAAAIAVPRHGVAVAYLSVMLRLAWYLAASRRPGNLVLSRLLRFGLAAGAFAVLADYLRAHALPDGRLIYLSRDAVLLGSPPYVLLGWACAVVEIVYLPLRLYGGLRGRVPSIAPIAIASVAAAALGGLGLGSVEVLAVRAGWWKYERTAAMLGPGVAAYAPLGEGLACLALVPLALRFLRAKDPEGAGALGFGIVFAAVLALAQVGAFWLLTLAARG